MTEQELSDRLNSAVAGVFKILYGLVLFMCVCWGFTFLAESRLPECRDTTIHSPLN